MKKIFLIVSVFLIFSWSGALSQDNIYGDYLIASLDKEVSLDFENAQLNDVLKLLSQQIGLNFVSTEAVEKRAITLYLENVPFKEAMDVIFKANGLSYDYYPDSKIFVVKELGKPSIELKTKIYYLKYARLATSKIDKHSLDMLEGESEESEEDEAIGIRDTVAGLLTEFGRMAEDPLTNSLIVTDVPLQFPIIDEVISKLDVPPAKVLIEVEMLDVATSHLDNIGFNFANGLTGSFTPGSRQTRFPWDNRLFGPGTGGADPTLSTLSLASFTAVMKFLTSDSSTKFIARPKILTLNNEKSEVNLTLDEVVGLTTTTNEDGSTTQEIEREDTGTRLTVTPQVNLLTKEITLSVEMFNRESQDSNISVSGMTSGFVKNVEERGTRSIVRLKNGETLFIGGLIKKESSETITKIPLLGDIPLLGRLFRYKNVPSTDNTNRELLVFLTPRILGEEGSSELKRAKVLFREQENSSKMNSIRIALDRYNR